MKLTGSRTEQFMREQLLASRRALFGDREMSRLMQAVRSWQPDVRDAVVLASTPEQGEDLYLVLMEGRALLRVEIDRTRPDAPPTVRALELSRYSKGLSRRELLRLAVALDLLESQRPDRG